MPQLSCQEDTAIFRLHMGPCWLYRPSLSYVSRLSRCQNTSCSAIHLPRSINQVLAGGSLTGSQTLRHDLQKTYPDNKDMSVARTMGRTVCFWGMSYFSRLDLKTWFSSKLHHCNMLIISQWPILTPITCSTANEWQDLGQFQFTGLDNTSYTIISTPTGNFT